ncbi:MAG: polysaccharide biosynthesis/export family protein [Candidatus Omnitrophica bacterium]|nr:polysaccharide biosynthesis/export family protein [Candidatus Omnitrophota bacterium]
MIKKCVVLIMIFSLTFASAAVCYEVEGEKVLMGPEEAGAEAPVEAEAAAPVAAEATVPEATEAVPADIDKEPVSPIADIDLTDDGDSEHGDSQEAAPVPLMNAGVSQAEGADLSPQEVTYTSAPPPVASEAAAVEDAGAVEAPQPEQKEVPPPEEPKPAVDTVKKDEPVSEPTTENASAGVDDKEAKVEEGEKDKKEDKKKKGKKSALKGEIRVIYAKDIVDTGWTIETYRVSSGDILEISVWQVEELHKEVVVRPDGRISFPLIGDVEVEGYTLDQIRSEIANKLTTYIKSPQVTVMVRDFGGKKVVILGEIGTPGVLRFTQPIRIMEAMALAGSWADSAGLKNVLVIRGDYENYTEIIVVNVIDILKGKFKENIYLRKDDIVYFPRSFLGNVAYLIQQIAPLLGAAATYYEVKTTYYNIKAKAYRTASMGTSVNVQTTIE